MNGYIAQHTDMKAMLRYTVCCSPSSVRFYPFFQASSSIRHSLVEWRIVQQMYTHILRPLKVSKRVYWCKKLFKNTDDARDYLRASRLNSARMENAVNAVHAPITRNPFHEQKILSQWMNLMPRTVLYVLVENLDFWAYKKYTRHFLKTHLRHLWLKRSK